MSSLPATAAPADKAGTGPEGHRRTSSAESGAGTETTLVGDDEPTLYAGAKLAELDHVLPSPTPCVPERAAKVSDLAATQGRVTPETPLGPPTCGTTTNDAQGSSTAAAPNTVSSFTATALAVADTTAHNPLKPNEAPKKASSKDRTHLAPACTCATEVHALARGDEGYGDVFAHALAHAITAAPVVTASYSIPNAPAAPIATAKSALAAIRGGNQPRVPIDWAAVATDAKAGAVPPPSAAALRHLGAVQQPLSTMQAAYVLLANNVRLEPSKREDVDDAAEQRLKDETDEIRAKVGRLIERAGKPATETRVKSPRASKKEIAAAVREAELADLEPYMFEHERNAHS